ncbi:hypothetical protein LA2_01020 [Lactobacillus amylovorus GRL 1112]|uniref:Uncharacterized protein n=1 Tax=Lactobacillus amylovorus (strain GRL 1112) TaxID=695560 RepID=E4SK57_LACAR|nr:hypothetical protein [Lactobacillus amylovorus]ADQ58201.1 hypothetical protein LA2_01020 [Lactobacillus amylovorus GRL 1112]
MTEAEAKSVELGWAKGGLSLYQITSGKYAGNYVLTGDAQVLTSTTPAKPADTSSDKINAGSSSVFYANTNTVVNISAVAATKSAPSAINGNIVYTDAKGQTILHFYTTWLTVPILQLLTLMAMFKIQRL